MRRILSIALGKMGSKAGHSRTPRNVADRRGALLGNDQGSLLPSCYGPPCEVNCNDVLIENSTSAKRHQGNIQFKAMLRDALKVYAKAKGHLSSTQQAVSCLNLLRNMLPRGRILKYRKHTDGTGAWYEIGKGPFF